MAVLRGVADTLAEAQAEVTAPVPVTVPAGVTVRARATVRAVSLPTGQALTARRRAAQVRLCIRGRESTLPSQTNPERIIR